MDGDIEHEEDLSVGVAEYLKEWGLSDETITNFEDNHITLKLLDDIQETELKELIPSLKDRILFKRGLKKLRNIIHATASDDTLSIDSDFSALSPMYSTSSDELPTTNETSSWYGEFLCRLTLKRFKKIELDFKTKFRGSELRLFKKWPIFLEKALIHLKTIKAASVCIKLIEENPSEDVRDFCYCAAIGYKIVPTVRIQCKDILYVLI